LSDQYWEIVRSSREGGKVKQQRPVVCRNPRKARKDAAVRAALVERLKATLARKGEKGLIGNRGLARVLKTVKGSVSPDEAALAADARLDGKFVLTTNADLPPAAVALTGKSLWRAARTFREQKASLHTYEAGRGHTP